MPEKEDGNSWIFELLLAAVILYFAWRAQPMLSYYDNLGIGNRMWERSNGFFEAALAIALILNNEALLFLTIAVPIAIFITRSDDSSKTGAGIAFFSLGPFGWYIGREFSKAFARKSACQSQSFFGFGCTLDGEPLLSFMLYSVIVVAAAFFVTLALLARRFANSGEVS